jgi:hypothetical protein
MPWRLRGLVSLTVLVFCACGGSKPTLPGAGPPIFLGQLGQPTHFAREGWIPFIDVAVGSTAVSVLIDTGSPVVLLDSSALGLASGPRTVALGAFGGSIQGLPVVATSLGGVDGTLGGTLWTNFALVIDYKASNAFLESSGSPLFPAEVLASGLEAPVHVAFVVRGGGAVSFPGCGAGCKVPPTRALVQVAVESQAPAWMMVDTGSSLVVLDPAFAAALPATGRPRLDGVIVNGIGGLVETYMTRLGSMAVGGDVDVSEPVLVAPDASTFDSLSAETGMKVVGLIGGGFLRWRAILIDYAALHLVFARYTDPSHVDPREYIRAGFTVALNGTSWTVTEVYRGTDAESAGLVRGDVVTQLDGTPLAGLDSPAVEALLAGRSVGDVVVVTVQRASGAIDLDVMVEDLLPAFTGP